jgi:hypothetical protein
MPIYMSAVTRVMPETKMIARENMNTRPMSRLTRPGAKASLTPAETDRARVAPKTTMAPPKKEDTRKAMGRFLSISHL